MTSTLRASAGRTEHALLLSPGSGTSSAVARAFAARLPAPKRDDVVRPVDGRFEPAVAFVEDEEPVRHGVPLAAHVFELGAVAG
jgi:hypothetical protein